MTPKAVKETARYWLQRLNVLLRFAQVDPWKLDNGALEKLRDEMLFAVMGNLSPQERQLVGPIFYHIATRKALSEAQRALDHELQRLLSTPTTAGPLAKIERAKFKIAGQELSIGFVRGAFDFRSHIDDFPSQVYRAFFDALKASGVERADFLHCSYCNNLFLPLRKLRKGTPVYCSTKCSTVIGSRNYRASLKKKRIREEKKRGKPVV